MKEANGRSRGRKSGQGLPTSLAIDIAPLKRRNTREILGNILNCPPYTNDWLRHMVWTLAETLETLKAAST